MIGDQNEFCIIEKNKFITHVIPFKQVLRAKSDYQDIKIANNVKYGKCLILDNAIQLAEYDEFMYHEFLVQPAMHMIAPKKVLVLGGGDGCACREVLKHGCVDEIVLVDIDEKVVNVCKTHLADMNKNSLNNPKVNVVIGDAKKYVDECTDKYNLIISDITDPDVVGEYFYSKEFVNKCKNLLTENGIFVTQAGMLSYDENLAKPIYDKISELFNHSVMYTTPYIGSFNSTWGFVMCSDSHKLDECEHEKVECKIFSQRMYAAMLVSANAVSSGSAGSEENKYYEKNCNKINV